MNLNRLKPFLFTALCVIAAGLAGCARQPVVKKTVLVNHRPGVPGGSYVETYQTRAEVIALNPAQREMTLQAPDGSTNSFIAGPKFLDFESYQVGSEVSVTVARELTAWFAPETPPPAVNVAEMVREQPGVKPGVLFGPTKELAATVLAVDGSKQEARLQLSDGRSATFKVRPDIDLTQVKPGTTGVIRISTALAVMKAQP